ncbi:MAG: sarcosine oxidase subunit delta [Bradyrhizobium sp.]|jgi:heterotetrameric sarcosine oxidase delta subunit|nr:sarcosine oxidase subunit delta [Bradyrhizobium sp.]
MRIKCPYCGSRDSGEFSYLGDATLKRPVDGEHDIDGAMFDYVYLRDNPAGQHREHWYHGAGCRSWLVVERDTRNHDILSVQLAFSEMAR